MIMEARADLHEAYLIRNARGEVVIAIEVGKRSPGRLPLGKGHREVGMASIPQNGHGLVIDGQARTRALDPQLISWLRECGGEVLVAEMLGARVVDVRTGLFIE